MFKMNSRQPGLHETLCKSKRKKYIMPMNLLRQIQPGQAFMYLHTRLYVPLGRHSIQWQNGSSRDRNWKTFQNLWVRHVSQGSLGKHAFGTSKQQQGMPDYHSSLRKPEGQIRTLKVFV